MSSREEIDIPMMTANLLAAALNMIDQEIYYIDRHTHVNLSANETIPLQVNIFLIE